MTVMRLDQLYRNSKRIDISIELFPPKTPEGTAKLFEKVEELRRLFKSIEEGKGSKTSCKENESDKKK